MILMNGVKNDTFLTSVFEGLLGGDLSFGNV